MGIDLNAVHNAGHRDIVAVGGSAGSIKPLCELLSFLPAHLPAIVLIALHRPPEREKELQHVLAFQSHLPVEIAHGGGQLQPAHCYIGYGRRHLIVDKNIRAVLLEDHFYKTHSVDALFNSLAQYAGRRTIGVVLSGMLKDGALGLRAIKDAGGLTLVQDPESAECDEMPKAAIAFGGPIDQISAIPALAATIRRQVLTSVPRSE